MGPKHFDVALSVGKTCRSAYQLRRIFGDAAVAGPFDAQITPRATLVRAILSGFAGMYEREDLSVVRGCVINRRFHTWHEHEYPKPATPEDLERYYDYARSRHDHLAAKARGLFEGRRTLLLCFSRPIPRAVLWLIALVVRLRYPLLRFHLVNGPAGDFTGHGEDVWMGSDPVWDRHLARFVPNAPITRNRVLRSKIWTHANLGVTGPTGPELKVPPE